MTELDRLEALLANPIGRNDEYWLMVEALPNLIRAARAAKEVTKHPDNGTLRAALRIELMPLYREVES